MILDGADASLACNKDKSHYYNKKICYYDDKCQIAVPVAFTSNFNFNLIKISGNIQ